MGYTRDAWFVNDSGQTNVHSRLNLGCLSYGSGSAAVLRISSYAPDYGARDSTTEIMSNQVLIGGALMPIGPGGIYPYDGTGWLGMPHNRFAYCCVYAGIGIGLTVTPTYQLHLSADSAAKPTSTTWYVPSDGRLKRDVTPVDRARRWRRSAPRPWCSTPTTG